MTKTLRGKKHDYVIYDELRRDKMSMWMPGIKHVYFNEPYTIVIWEDGTKTKVKTHEEEYSKEHGLAMAVAKKYFGNRSRMKKAIAEEKFEAHTEFRFSVEPYDDGSNNAYVSIGQILSSSMTSFSDHVTASLRG